MRSVQRTANVASASGGDRLGVLLARLERVKPAGADRYLALCPGHDDRRQSLSVTLADDRVLLKCHAGCETKQVVSKIGLRMSDLFLEERSRDVSSSARQGSEVVYPYEDGAGRLLFEVVRLPGKTFRQRRPDPNDFRRRIPNLHGVTRVLYRLPKLVAADRSAPVFVAEGEKDADRLSRLGLIATTNPGGTGSTRLWDEAHFTRPLRGRDVVILPDNDAPGRKHAAGIAKALRGCARSVKVVDLPNVPPKGDVSDWIAAGGTREVLMELVAGVADAAPDRQGAGERERLHPAQVLVEFARQNCQLFKTPADEAFVTIKVEGRPQTWPVRSRAFELLLTRAFFRSQGRSPSANAVTEALNTIEAMAATEGATAPVELRVGAASDRLYIDLGDDSWRVVEADGGGWRLVDGDQGAVRFRRARTIRPLPVPVNGGSIEQLREFVNAGTEENFRLLVTWLLYAFQPRGPFPVLVLQGEQGSAKSTTARVLRAFIDPSQAPLRITPKQDADLLIAAKNSWVLAYDNLSGMPGWLSDGLCIVATGGAYTTRALYTNDEESVLEASRPVIVNGIDDMATRPDFASRAIVVTLPPIAEGARREEAEFWARLGERRAAIFGALCSAVSGVLRLLPTVTLHARPRMADFARWGVAVERALGWPAGAFMRSYQHNLRDAETSALEADAVASAVVALLDGREDWAGTATELLHDLERITPEARRGRKWPTAPNHLTSRIRRAAVPLRQERIELVDDRTGAKRILTLRRQRPGTTVTSVRTDSAAGSQDDSDDGVESRDDAAPSAMTVRDDAAIGTVIGSQLLVDYDCDGGDDDDGHHSFQVSEEEGEGP